MGLFKFSDPAVITGVSLFLSGVGLGVWPKIENCEDLGYLLIIMGILIFALSSRL